MATKKEIIAKEMITPSSATPPNLRRHKFSFLDRRLPPIYIPLVLFYGKNSSSPDSEKSQICHHLKQCLIAALTKFYPLAGKIDDEDAFIDCNDSGALFVEAHVHARLSEAIETTTINNLGQYLPTKPSTVSDILLAVQINFFECGGIAIGACFSHRVGDLMSFVTFLNAWAATCRCETETAQPNFDLGCHFFPPPSRGPVESTARMKLLKEKLAMKRFVFDKERLLHLKALAHEVKDPTRVEVVSAFIYQQFMEINRAKVNPKRMFAFSNSVNLRPRMRQLQELLAINQFAFGNLSPAAFSPLLTYEKVEKFHDLVSGMRTVIRKFRDEEKESVRDKVVSANDDFMALKSNPEVLYLHFTSWCKFPFHGVDCGWGKPLVACTQAIASQNIVRLLDTKDGEGVQALVTMVDEDMELLPSEFLSLENNDFNK